MLRTNLKATNSLTKYPSIPTYHALGERGRVTDTVQVDFGAAPVLVTEKVDGANARIICHDGDYLIGSREELLHARGDSIHNPALGIVDAIRPIAERLVGQKVRGDSVLVLYGEVYGGKVTAASKSYTSSGAVGFRAFDAQDFYIGDFEKMAEWAPEKIASWRESGDRKWFRWTDLRHVTDPLGVETVPVLGGRFGRASTSPADTLAWMRQVISATHAGIDASGRPEGLVVRTADRSKIAKLRFEDYERRNR